MSKTMITAEAQYTFNTTKVEAENQQHLAFISDFMIYESNLSANAFRTWVILRREYKKQYSVSKDILKCYTCQLKWLQDKTGIKSKDTMSKVIAELTTKGFLFSIPSNGGASYRVALDPADNDYMKTLNTIKCYMGEAAQEETPKQAKPAQEVAPEAPVVAVDAPKQEEVQVAQVEATAPSEWDFNRFIAYVKRNFSLVAIATPESKTFSVNTGRADLKNTWNEGLAAYGWSVI